MLRTLSIIIGTAMSAAIASIILMAAHQHGVAGQCDNWYPLTQDLRTIWQPTGRITVPMQKDQQWEE